MKPQVYLATAMLSIVPLNLWAASIACSGVPTYVGIANNGGLTVALDTIPVHTICNVQSQGSYGYGTEACKAVYALLMARMSSRGPVELYYSDGPTSCAAITSWTVLPSFYFAAARE